MRFTARSTLALAALATLSLGALPLGAQAANPTVKQLLDRSRAAARALGPATIQAKMIQLNAGRTQDTADVNVRQNDLTHAAMSVKTAEGTFDIYLNGDDVVMYQPGEKEYMKLPGEAAEEGPLAIFLGNTLESLQAGPSAAKDMAKAKVETLAFDGAPAWRATWTNSTATGASQPSRITLIVNKSDGLLRKLSMLSTNQTGVSFQFGYKKAQGAFPAATFTFTPPEGVTEFDPAKSGGEQPDPGADFRGKPAPDFTLTPLGGGDPVTLSGLKGKTVLIDFWATWCPPCRRSLPVLNQARKDFADKGLVVLSINDEKDAKVVQDYMTRNGLGFTVLRDTENAAGKAYKVTAIPTSVLVGPDGNVLQYHVGFAGEEGFWKMLADAGFKK